MTTPEGREVSTRRINDQRQLREWPVNWLLSNGPPRTLSAALRVDQEALPGTTEMKVALTATESSSMLDRSPCTSCITVADSTHPSAGNMALSIRGVAPYIKDFNISQTHMRVPHRLQLDQLHPYANYSRASVSRYDLLSHPGLIPMDWMMGITSTNGLLLLNCSHLRSQRRHLAP